MKLLFFAILTVFFVFVWFRLIDFNKSFSLLLSLNLKYIILALILTLIGSILQSIRLKNLFKIIKAKVCLNDLWAGGWISTAVSSFLPFYAGGFLYAKIISKKADTTYLKSFSILFLDFLMGLSITFALGLAGAIYFGLEKPIVLIVFLFLALAACLYILGKKPAFRKFLKKENLKYISYSFLIGIITNLLGLMHFYLFFRSFGLTMNIFKFSLTQSLFSVINILPGAPLKIGQYELSGILVFSYLLGFDKNLISTIFAVQHIVSILLIMFLGLVSLLMLAKKP